MSINLQSQVIGTYGFLKPISTISETVQDIDIEVEIEESLEIEVDIE
jgi:hypothetical protein